MSKKKLDSHVPSTLADKDKESGQRQLGLDSLFQAGDSPSLRLVARLCISCLRGCNIQGNFLHWRASQSNQLVPSHVVELRLLIRCTLM